MKNIVAKIHIHKVLVPSYDRSKYLTAPDQLPGLLSKILTRGWNLNLRFKQVSLGDQLLFAQRIAHTQQLVRFVTLRISKDLNNDRLLVVVISTIAHN
jgi:hypothetical protein